MTSEEKITRLFGQQFKNDISQELQTIIKYLENQQDSVTVSDRALDIDDITKRYKDPTYLKDKSIEYTDDGVIFLTYSKELFKILLPHINKKVTKLNISKDMLINIEQLQCFTNLQEINFLTPTRFKLAEIKKLYDKLNIKKVTGKYISYLEEVKSSKDIIILQYPYNLIKYKDLYIKQAYNGPFPSCINAIVNNVTVNLSDAISAVNYVKPKGMQKEYILNIKEQSSLEKPHIEQNTISILFGINNEIKCIHIRNDKNPSEVKKIIETLEKLNYEIKDIEYYCENKTYDDIEELEQISKKYPLNIIYSINDTPADYLSFCSMRATIDYYKSLINENNLSPAEKLLYAYDIIKGLKYNEQKRYSSTSRELHSIVQTGEIVCTGYSLFLETLLNEIDIKTISVSINCYDENNNITDYHRRNLALIDDDKYNIHGLFSLDVTWDSRKDDLAIVIDSEGKIQVRYQPFPGDIIEKN